MLCNDTDILKYEPGLFGEFHPANQVLAKGQNGELAGTTFTADGADFELAGVEAGSVIYLETADSSLDGAYEVAAVDSAEQLCVSVLRRSSEDEPVAPPAGTQTTGITYRVSTLGPQIEQVSIQIEQYFTTLPGHDLTGLSLETILNSKAVRQLCALGTIALVYASAVDSQNSEQCWKKHEHYKQMFGKALERIRVELDENGDGVGDSVRFGGCGRLVRE
jgi:hypothetical protein